MWSKSTFALDFVVGFEDTYVDAWLYSDHQRYFFFQVGDTGVRSALLHLLTVPSTVGAPLSNPALALTLTQPATLHGGRAAAARGARARQVLDGRIRGARAGDRPH